MQKVSRFFQIFFKFLMIFFISFIWVRYFVKSLWQSVLISLAITIFIDIISRIFTKKKNAHILLKSKEREKAENCFGYLRTKLVRFLILQTLAGMNISISNFKFVPWKDFSREWSDEDLYEYYDLSDDEVAYVESLIRDMGSV